MQPTIILRLFLLYFILGFITACYTAVVANAKGHNKFTWFAKALFFNLIALIAIAGMPIKQSALSQKH